jgi:hypothetical protein
VVVVEHAAHAYACKNCEKSGKRTPFAKAKAPAALIRRLAGFTVSGCPYCHAKILQRNASLPN